jgi:hypothetical protein
MSPSSPIPPASAQGGKPLQSESKTTRHYRLTTEEWLQAVHELKPRERDVLYYLRTLDPFGDRCLNLGVREIARTLSTDQQEVSPGTISKALKRLDHLGYIDMELINVSIKIKSRGGVFPTENSVSSEKRLIATGNDRSPQETADRYRKRSIATGNDRPLEAAPDIDSGSPHTIHTLHTDQTLSLTHPPAERDLLKFVVGEIKKDKQVRQPRAYAKQCLEKDRDFWTEKFLEWQTEHDRIKRSAAAPPSTDFFELKQLEQRRTLLLENWKVSRLRNKIREAIATQPELKLEIVGEELREVEP